MNISNILHQLDYIHRQASFLAEQGVFTNNQQAPLTTLLLIKNEAGIGPAHQTNHSSPPDNMPVNNVRAGRLKK